MAFMSRSPDKHHQIVLAGGRPKDTPSQINQISFRVETLSDLRNFNSTLQEEGSIDSLIQTTHGVSWSLYFNDPRAIEPRYLLRRHGIRPHRAVCP